MNNIETLFQQITTMQWTDYLDIAIVAYLLYKLLPLLRNNGTKQIAKAIGVIFAIAWLADLLNLYTLSFIIEQFMQIGLIALVILFQPELRRILDHLGNMKFRKFFGVEKNTQDMENIINQTVIACEVMSRERVGALIVFARDNRLEEYIKTGTKLEATVSDQLIRNIFFPKASLHDGAMIIRDGRVSAAGCVLPLTTRPLNADLGTRHRAGVGISEASDAVTIIISEETGTISVAVGATFKRHLAPQTLRQLLRKELCPDETPDQENPVQRLKQKLKGNKKEAKK